MTNHSKFTFVNVYFQSEIRSKKYILYKALKVPNLLAHILNQSCFLDCVDVFEIKSIANEDFIFILWNISIDISLEIGEDILEKDVVSTVVLIGDVDAFKSKSKFVHGTCEGDNVLKIYFQELDRINLMDGLRKSKVRNFNYNKNKDEVEDCNNGYHTNSIEHFCNGKYGNDILNSKNNQNIVIENSDMNNNISIDDNFNMDFEKNQNVENKHENANIEKNYGYDIKIEDNIYDENCKEAENYNQAINFHKNVNSEDNYINKEINDYSEFYDRVNFKNDYESKKEINIKDKNTDESKNTLNNSNLKNDYNFINRNEVKYKNDAEFSNIESIDNDFNIEDDDNYVDSVNSKSKSYIFSANCTDCDNIESKKSFENENHDYDIDKNSKSNIFAPNSVDSKKSLNFDNNDKSYIISCGSTENKNIEGDSIENSLNNIFFNESDCIKINNDKNDNFNSINLSKNDEITFNTEGAKNQIHSNNLLNKKSLNSNLSNNDDELHTEISSPNLIIESHGSGLEINNKFKTNENFVDSGQSIIFSLDLSDNILYSKSDTFLKNSLVSDKDFDEELIVSSKTCNNLCNVTENKLDNSIKKYDSFNKKEEGIVINKMKNNIEKSPENDSNPSIESIENLEFNKSEFDYSKIIDLNNEKTDSYDDLLTDENIKKKIIGINMEELQPNTINLIDYNIDNVNRNITISTKYNSCDNKFSLEHIKNNHSKTDDINNLPNSHKTIGDINSNSENKEEIYSLLDNDAVENKFEIDSINDIGKDNINSQNENLASNNDGHANIIQKYAYNYNLNDNLNFKIEGKLKSLNIEDSNFKEAQNINTLLQNKNNIIYNVFSSYKNENLEKLDGFNGKKLFKKNEHDEYNKSKDFLETKKALEEQSDKKFVNIEYNDLIKNCDNNSNDVCVINSKNNNQQGNDSDKSLENKVLEIKKSFVNTSKNVKDRISNENEIEGIKYKNNGEQIEEAKVNNFTNINSNDIIELKDGTNILSSEIKKEYNDTKNVYDSIKKENSHPENSKKDDKNYISSKNLNSFKESDFKSELSKTNNTLKGVDINSEAFLLEYNAIKHKKIMEKNNINTSPIKSESLMNEHVNKNESHKFNQSANFLGFSTNFDYGDFSFKSVNKKFFGDLNTTKEPENINKLKENYQKFDTTTNNYESEQIKKLMKKFKENELKRKSFIELNKKFKLETENNYNYLDRFFNKIKQQENEEISTHKPNEMNILDNDNDEIKEICGKKSEKTKISNRMNSCSIKEKMKNISEKGNLSKVMSKYYNSDRFNKSQRYIKNKLIDTSETKLDTVFRNNNKMKVETKDQQIINNNEMKKKSFEIIKVRLTENNIESSLNQTKKVIGKKIEKVVLDCSSEMEKSSDVNLSDFPTEYLHLKNKQALNNIELTTICKYFHNKRVVQNKFNIKIYKNDINTLLESGWLNDKIINIYFLIMLEDFEQKSKMEYFEGLKYKSNSFYADDNELQKKLDKKIDGQSKTPIENSEHDCKFIEKLECNVNFNEENMRKFFESKKDTVEKLENDEKIIDKNVSEINEKEITNFLKNKKESMEKSENHGKVNDKNIKNYNETEKEFLEESKKVDIKIKINTEESEIDEIFKECIHLTKIEKNDKCYGIEEKITLNIDINEKEKCDDCKIELAEKNEIVKETHITPKNQTEKEICKNKNAIKKSLKNEIKEFDSIGKEMAENNIENRIALNDNIENEIKIKFNITNAESETTNKKEIGKNMTELLKVTNKNIIKTSETEKNYKFYILTTFFFTTLKQKGCSFINENWFKKVDLTKYENILIPIHLTVHWIFAHINIKEKSIEVYDSMLIDRTTICKRLKNWIETVFTNKGILTDFKFNSLRNIPTQKNGNDCGVFVCFFAKKIFSGQEIEDVNLHASNFRKFMVHEIGAGKILYHLD